MPCANEYLGKLMSANGVKDGRTEIFTSTSGLQPIIKRLTAAIPSDLFSLAPVAGPAFAGPVSTGIAHQGAREGAGAGGGLGRCGR
jgi:hypothetical protein